MQRLGEEESRFLENVVLPLSILFLQKPLNFVSSIVCEESI